MHCDEYDILQQIAVVMGKGISPPPSQSCTPAPPQRSSPSSSGLRIVLPVSATPLRRKGLFSLDRLSGVLSTLWSCESAVRRSRKVDGVAGDEDRECRRFPSSATNTFISSRAHPCRFCDITLGRGTYLREAKTNLDGEETSSSFVVLQHGKFGITSLESLALIRYLAYSSPERLSLCGLE